MSSLLRLSLSTRLCVDRMSSYDWPPPETSPSFLFRSMFISFICNSVQSFAKVLVGWRGGDPFWSDDFWVYWLTGSLLIETLVTVRASGLLVLRAGLSFAYSFNYRQFEQKGPAAALSSVLCFISTLSCPCDQCVAGCDKGSTSPQSIWIEAGSIPQLLLTGFTHIGRPDFTSLFLACDHINTSFSDFHGDFGSLRVLFSSVIYRKTADSCSALG